MLFSWDLLLTGFADALTWTNLLWALVGCLVGTLIGVLPGIGPSAGIAILLPMTTMIPPTSGIIMMAAIYYGAMYGGSTTAIVVNIPGEASSVPTCIDGYEMAKQGRAGAALGISAISSFVAGTLGLVGLTFFAPLLANFALAFGPPEYFALMFMGLSLVISLSGRALLKGMIATSIGLLSSLIGQNPLTGAARLTFGVVDLMAGLNFISIIIGLFAVSEVMINVERRRPTSTGRSSTGGCRRGRRSASAGHHAPLVRHRLLPRAAARVRPRGDDLHRVRRREEGLENPGAVREGGDRGGRGAGRGEQRHLQRRLRPALRLRAADRPRARRADGRPHDVRASAGADALPDEPEVRLGGHRQHVHRERDAPGVEPSARGILGTDRPHPVPGPRDPSSSSAP